MPLIKRLFIIGFWSVCGTVQAEQPPLNFERGKQVAFQFEQGNCLACHQIADGDNPGNIGPELKQLSTRFKDKSALRDFIWDAGQFNPNTSMPPFGKNKILNEAQLEAVVDYLWSVP